MFKFLSDAEWVDSRVRSLPPKWERRLRRAYERRRKTDYYGANVELREATAQLLRVLIPLDASDAELCDVADALAARCIDRTSLYKSITQARQAMERVCLGQGIEPPAPTTEDGPAVSRMCCSYWWRRKLRRHQGQTVESAAVRLGYVSRSRALYVSDERLATRRQQHRRNAATLEATFATNEQGQTFSLAELASKSPANKAIRRAELMTRIAGFERYAEGVGDERLFLTLTCPSRFHRYTSVNGGKLVIENPRHDPKETPRAAHRYLCAVWARIRAKLARLGIRPYGFRIAEPQHDATPHWHLLLLCPADHAPTLLEVMREHALQDTPEESGAAKHRFDAKQIDPSRGSAAGYIAKYIAKNIDGAHVGEDLEGRPATESAERVDAWANTWRIRQFQQIGGPPVGVWRELRRIARLPDDAPRHLHQAHRAANKQVQRDGDERASVAWDEYCHAQGGAACGRKASIALARRMPKTASRYGDAPGLRPFGVQTVGAKHAGNADDVTADACLWVVKSTRQSWTVVQQSRLMSRGDSSVGRARPDLPRTRVNNCTAQKRTGGASEGVGRYKGKSRFSGGLWALAQPDPL